MQNFQAITLKLKVIERLNMLFNELHICMPGTCIIFFFFIRKEKRNEVFKKHNNNFYKMNYLHIFFKKINDVHLIHVGFI